MLYLCGVGTLNDANDVQKFALPKRLRRRVFMKIAVVTNGFYKTQKTETIKDMIAAAFCRRGVTLTDLRNDAKLVSNGCKFDFDGAVFWDKDLLLAKKMEDDGVRLFNGSETIRICDDKGLTFLSALKRNLPMPVTVAAPFTYANIGYTNTDFLDEVTSKIDFPIIVKESSGSFGMQVYMAKNHDELLGIVSKIGAKNMIFQQYIECGNTDLRLQVVGGKVVAAVKRRSLNGDFRANATLGGIMEKYLPTNEEISIAVEAAKAVNADFAGVDILPGDKPYLCEVNSNAHFKNLMDATGINAADFIANWVLEKLCEG